MRSTTPLPAHVRQGSSITVPWPPHWPHVLAIVKKPCWKRIWPVPRHAAQVCAPRRPWRPLALAGPARRQTWDVDDLLGTENGFFKPDLEIVAQVLPAPGAVTAAATEEVAEDVAEDVLEAGAGEIESAETAALLKGGVPEAIVLRAPLGIAEHLIGFRSFLEPLLRSFVSRIAIGMVLHGQLAVGLLDFLFAGVAATPRIS